jgi:hypothetical protein
MSCIVEHIFTYKPFLDGIFMGDFKFGLGHHYDVFLRIGEGEHLNFGYNVVRELPIVPWLFYWQIGGENMFRDMRLLASSFEATNDYRDEKKSLAESVGDAMAFWAQLPLAAGEFGCKLPQSLRGFYAGNNTTKLEWDYDGSSLHLDRTPRGRETERVLSLSFSDSKEFVSDYLAFLGEDPHLDVVYSDALWAVNKLRMVGV